MTDPLGQSQVLAYLRELSLKNHYRFIIISFEKENAFESSRAVVEKICEEAGITWHPLKYTKKPPVLSTFRDVNAMLKKSKEIIRQEEVSLVHCRSYIASLAGVRLKKEFGIPFLFDMRGFWADERVDGGIWNLSNPLYKIIYGYFKKKEKQFLLQADEIVSLTENAKQEILTWGLGLQASSITVIPCCADFDIFNPEHIKAEALEEARRKLEIPGEAQVFSYLGTLGTWYMVDEMMRFAKVYQDINPQAYFMILSGDPVEVAMKAAVRAGFDTRFLRMKKLSRNEVPVYLSISSFSLFFIKPAYSKKASSPVKQGELMAMGIPVICNDNVGDTASIVNTNQSGIVISKFDDRVLKEAAVMLEKAGFDRKAIREKGKAVFSLSHGKDLYAEVYQKIFSKSQIV
jgi:glycosyltransferase involved in cell wall biosynthesis